MSNESQANRSAEVGATPAQVRAIYLLGLARVTSKADIDARCVAEYQCRPEGLTKRQASAFIASLVTPRR